MKSSRAPMEFAGELADRLTDCGIPLAPGQQDKLVAYLESLRRWNGSFNLTAIQEHRWVNELLLDALVALPYIRSGAVLDVGSGAGVPAIPLAIALPTVRFTLLDSNGKKTRFIKQVVIDLQISNVDVVQSRIEDYTSPSGFVQITSRAFAALDLFLSKTAHLLQPGGEWLAWKGENLAIELNKLGPEIEHLQTIPVSLPGAASPRYLVRLRKNG